MSNIWIASFPRSGNTFLRTILWHCFKLRTASVYQDDFGENSGLGKMVGHVELSSGEKFMEGELALIKTHNPPEDNNPTIYIVRDGRAATISLWHFYQKNISLKNIIRGHHRFATWSMHINAWDPWKRPNSLLLKYEDLLHDLPSVLNKLSLYLQKDIESTELPSRKEIADIDGKWVRNPTDWRKELKGADLDFFKKTNHKMMSKLKYQ